MTSRTFQFRLRSSHGEPDLTSQSVEVDRLSEEGEWQPQNPSLNTPPWLRPLEWCKSRGL